jgi:gliding motility-associated lipoprotein GldJ
MKNKFRNMRFILFFSFLAGGLLLGSCARESSTSTGWEYNNSAQGGFEKVPFIDQETGPGLNFIEGGTFTMGRAEQDVMFDWNNRPARVTVSSFYMDATEVTNFHWLEYLYWISRAYAEYPVVYQNALPDTLCWRSPLGFNEKYVDYYLRHPAYRDYPVVGVSWLQANDFCKWRTDRVNEYIMIREGILQWNPRQNVDETFNTDAYLGGTYHIGVVTGEEERKELKDKKRKGQLHYGLTDITPDISDEARVGDAQIKNRIVRMEDGILLPRYRLPTEAEWEFAAAGLIGNVNQETIEGQRIYPWDGHWVREDEEQFKGGIRANFVRGKGDYMGIAGHLNDGADVTAPVESYWPNDYGLYHMAGNVSEWVMDVYRPLSSEDFDDFRPFRGNVFKTKMFNSEGIVDKQVTVQYDVHGMKEYLNEFERVRYQRISGKTHDPKQKDQFSSLNDKNIPNGVDRKVASRNDVKPGYQPDPIFVSHNFKKDSIELAIIKRINLVLDSAIWLKNEKYEFDAYQLINDSIYETSSGIFATIRTSTTGSGNEYAYEIIAMIKEGFSDYLMDTPGKIKYRNVTEEENIGRLNYRKDDYIDYLDGDIESSLHYNDLDRLKSINEGSRDPNLVMYQNEHEAYDLLKGDSINSGGNKGWPSTLISDKSRVYKGGSWKDRAYWLAVGNRRYLDEDRSMSTLGFRCCMDRIGSPYGQNYGRDKQRKR